MSTLFKKEISTFTLKLSEYWIKVRHPISKYLPLNTGIEISEYIIIQFNIFEDGIYYFSNAN